MNLSNLNFICFKDNIVFNIEVIVSIFLQQSCLIKDLLILIFHLFLCKHRHLTKTGCSKNNNLNHNAKILI